MGLKSIKEKFEGLRESQWSLEKLSKTAKVATIIFVSMLFANLANASAQKFITLGSAGFSDGTANYNGSLNFHH